MSSNGLTPELRNNTRLKDVAASFKYGRFLSLGWRVFFWTLLILAFLGIGSFIVVFFELFVNVSQFEQSTLFGFIGCCAMFLLGIGIVIYFFMRYFRSRELILRCLKDETLVRRTVLIQKAGDGRGAIYQRKAYKIKISFRIDGKKYHKSSKVYDTIFGCYLGKETDILYSPQYDEVLVLKKKKDEA